MDEFKKICNNPRESKILRILNDNIEKKYQQTDGSVDEKLQTSGFKLKQYRKLVEGTSIEVKFIYVLNDWFHNPRYKDVLDYIKEVKCDYFFNEIPIEVLGLPK